MMALGIGPSTALFSVVYGVLIKPLPWPDSDRLVRVTEARRGQSARLRGTVSNGAYLAWREQSMTLEAIGGYGIVPMAMTALVSNTAEPQRIQTGRLTASMFDVLGVSPLRGRRFLDADEIPRPGAYLDPAVVILSYGLWQASFGGNDDVIGKTIRLDERPVTIVGVMPRGFVFPDRDTRAWLPLPIGGVVGDNNVRRLMIFGSMARLMPGVRPERAAAEGTARARTAPDPGFAAVSMFGSDAPSEISVTPAADAITADIRPALLLLLFGVGLLLGTSTANVGSLVLARATIRRRELAVRAAIGASRGRLLRQLFVESAVIATAGGLCGLAFTAILIRVLPRLLPPDFPRVDDIDLNLSVLTAVVGVTVVSAVACAAFPALSTARTSLTSALTEESAASAPGSWHSRSARLRTVIVGAQVAVACVLLVGATLLVRSFVTLMHADRGYDPTNVLTARVDLPRRYTGPDRAAFSDAVIERMRGTPGTLHAAAGNALPFVSLGGGFAFELKSPVHPGMTVKAQAITRIVSPEYFAAMGVRLIAGRLLLSSDTATARPVVVVNRSFASRYLGSRPVGMQIPMPSGEERPDAYVVGVVADMRQGEVTDAPAAEVFASYQQLSERLADAPTMFVLRTADDPTKHIATLRDAIRQQDPLVAVDSIVTMNERLATSLAKPRLYAVLLGAFAVAALVIAAVGLFGVLSYSVAQRSREIAIRTALGAQTADITRLVLRSAMAIAMVGVMIGLSLAYQLTRFLSSLLYGVGPSDGSTYLAVFGGVAVVIGVACIVPARRAASIDLLRALRTG